MKELLGVARHLGMSVHIAHLDDDPELLGFCCLEEGVIVLRFGLTRAESRSVLAHELGHAHHGHTCDSPSSERQAQAYAARLLIDPERYAALERISHDSHFLAEEMNVTVDVIDAYREHCLTRLQGVTYARSKMGFGQWAARHAN